MTDASTAQSGPSLIVYSHIGPHSELLTEHTAEGSLLLRDDLRQPDGLLAAPLGVLVLNCASTNTHLLGRSAPTRIDVHVYEAAADVSELRIRGHILRAGRTQIFTEARIEDSADPRRVVAFGTTCFAVTGPPSGGYGHGTSPPTPRPGDDVPPLTEVFGGRLRDDGNYDIPELTPELGAGRLHSAVMQTLAEAASMNVVRRRTGAGRMRTDQLGTTVMTEGRVGPFTVLAEVLAADDTSAACRVEVVDVGAGDKSIALITVRLRLLGD
jgi:acyl-coenzyme A thioesterase PaaI-like protein